MDTTSKEKSFGRGKSFVGGAAILAVAGLIAKVIGALFRIPLSNAVGSIGMSYYEVAYPYYAALLVISSAGLPTAISKMVSERVTLGDYKGARQVFRVAMLILIAIGIITSIVMFLCSDLLAGLSTFDKASLSFKALAPALLFVSVMCAYRGYLQGLQMMTGTAVSQLVEQLGKLLVGLTLAIKLLPRGAEYAAMGALVGVSVSELAALIVIALFYFAKKRRFDSMIAAAGRTHRAAQPGTIAKQLMMIAIPVTIGATISPLTGIVDSALIGRILKSLDFSEAAAQTAYSLLRTNVTTLVNMPGVLTTALAMSLVPAVSSFMALSDKKGVRSVSRTGMKLALIIGMPCASGVFVLARPILTLLYSNLTEEKLLVAEPLMRVAAVGIIFLSLVQTMTGIIQGLGRPKIPVVNLFIGFIVKVISLVLLMRIPSVNILGAAISTVLCYIVAAVLDTAFVVRTENIHVGFYDVFIKPLLASLVMAAVVLASYKLIASMGHPNLATLASICIGTLIYGVLVLALRMFSDSDLKFIPGGNKIRALLRKGRA